MKSALDEIIKRLEAGWCQGALARDKYGNRVNTHSPNATQFCAIGACWSVIPEDATYRALIRKLGDKVGAIATWNDRSTQAEVIKVFKEIRDEIQKTEDE